MLTRREAGLRHVKSSGLDPLILGVDDLRPPSRDGCWVSAHFSARLRRYASAASKVLAMCMPRHVPLLDLTRSSRRKVPALSVTQVPVEGNDRRTAADHRPQVLHDTSKLSGIASSSLSVW